MSWWYGGPTEGGQGGKLGHGNMSHWTGTREIKIGTKKRRRADRRKIAHRAKRDGYDGL